jgi:hypothetical protein
MVAILLFHVRQFELQALAGEQPFVEVVPLAPADELAGRVAPLEVEGAFGLMRLVQRQLRPSCCSRR